MKTRWICTPQHIRKTSVYQGKFKNLSPTNEINMVSLIRLMKGNGPMNGIILRMSIMFKTIQVCCTDMRKYIVTKSIPLRLHFVERKQIPMSKKLHGFCLLQSI